METPKRPPVALGVQVEHISPSELYDVLTAASSQDPARVQASGKRLKQMLDMFGTYDALHEIAAQKTVPLTIRQQAIIQFKNAALNHWRSRKVLNDEHRVRIRNRCLTLLDEEDETIAKLNKIIVSKISRQDFPNNWVNLINDLLTAVDMNLQKRYQNMSEDPQTTLVLRRNLELFNSILKEFASMKMLTGVKTMANLVISIYPVLYGYYSQIAPTISSSTVTPETLLSSPTYDSILLPHLLYKCLAKMVIWLWHRIDKMSKEEAENNQAWIRELFQRSALQLRSLTELRHNTLIALVQVGSDSNPHAQRSIDIMTRHIRTYGKFFRRMQQLSPSRFHTLPMCSDLIFFYWSQVVKATSDPAGVILDSNQAIYPVRNLLQGMVLFKESLAQWTPTRRDGTPNENFLSKDFIENAIHLLITRFMPLNPRDLENWLADPEEWVTVEEKENELWEYEIRPCSERVLMQLCHQYPEFVTPLLEAAFKQVAAQPPAVDLQTILQKEALYCALGRCAISLKDLIPFNDWLDHTLSTEARSTNRNYPIIKRRIAWLIGRWVSDSGISPNNPRLWEVLVHLLKDRGIGTDYVVRLTAVMAIKQCLDVLDFAALHFEPYLPVVVSEFLEMMGEADAFESKRRINDSLIVVIEQVKELITPSIATITEPLPKLWTEAGDQWLFKGSLLRTVLKLVESTKAQSTPLGGIVVPLIRESLSPGAMTHLDEDGINLWLTALRNTLTVVSVNGAPALLDLFPLGMDLLSKNFDLLGKTISIMESYFLLDSPGILQACSVPLFVAFLTAFKSESVMPLNATDMMRALNLLIQTAPSSLWGEALHTSGLFPHILTALMEGEESTLLLAEQVLFLSRVAIIDRQMFLQLTSAAASAYNMKESQVYDRVLDQWFGKFDNMGEPRQRKLAAMGIASLVSTANADVLQRLPVEIFNLWIDVFYEIKEARVNVENEEDSFPSPNNLERLWELDEAPEQYYQKTEGTPEYDRRKSVYDRDPVRTTHLGTFIGAHIRGAEAACGPGVFSEKYLSKADPTVLNQIQVELSRIG